MKTRKYKINDKFIHKTTKKVLIVVNYLDCPIGVDEPMYQVSYKDSMDFEPIPSYESSIDKYFFLLKDNRITEALYL